MCPSSINNHRPSLPQQQRNDFRDLYSKLPLSIQRICGKIQLPEDGGTSLIQHLLHTDQPLVGVSDASLKDGTSGHTWILSTGNLNHINDPMMQITGSGPVDGYHADLSSARGEIQGQTALAIVTSTLLTAQQQPCMKVTYHGDNKGTQNKCATAHSNRLRDHQQPNTDLYLEFHHYTRTLNKKIEWVKGHQDSGKDWEQITDLQHLKLSSAAYMNIWCDHQANAARQSSTSAPEADVLPSKKWAVFTCYPVTRKIIGKLDDGIQESMYTEAILKYLHKKHNICRAKLDTINTDGMKSYMRKLKITQRASVAKLIRDWIPTNDFLHKQNRSDTNLCPRCHTCPEDANHILICNGKDARNT
jgi:hypothetical protein